MEFTIATMRTVDKGIRPPCTSLEYPLTLAWACPQYHAAFGRLLQEPTRAGCFLEPLEAFKKTFPVARHANHAVE